MALDFLSGLSGGLGGVSPMIGGIGNILSAFGVGKPKINYSPTPSEQQANSLLLALSQPNNSLVNYETDINMQKGMNDILMALKQQQMMDARRQGRGLRGTFFNPERADESINYLTTRSIPSVRANATAQAKSDILNRANSLMGIAANEQARRAQKQGNQQLGFQQFQTAGGFGGMGQSLISGLQDLLSAFGGGKTAANSAFMSRFGG